MMWGNYKIKETFKTFFFITSLTTLFTFPSASIIIDVFIYPKVPRITLFAFPYLNLVSEIIYSVINTIFRWIAIAIIQWQNTGLSIKTWDILINTF